MVDHHRQIRQLADEGRDVAQVPGTEQEVEGDAVPLEDPEAPQDVCAHNPVVVGLVVGDVPDADKRGMTAQLDKLLLAGLAGKVDPADHSSEERGSWGHST